MAVSELRCRKPGRWVRRVVAVIIIGAMGFPGSLVPAEVVRAIAHRALDTSKGPIELTSKSGHLLRSGQTESSSERADRVAFVRLCPRRLSLHVGEAFTLVPMPIDENREAVHGISMAWETTDPRVAAVSSWGEVSALAAGLATVTVQAGAKRANVGVEVRNEPRPVRDDPDWDVEHRNDCSDPDATAMNESQPGLAEWVLAIARRADQVDKADVTEEANSIPQVLKQQARPAVLRGSGRGARHAVGAATSNNALSRALYQPAPILDGESPDTTAAQAARFSNAVGSPRFSPQETSENSATKTKKNLGSYNYLFAAPVLGLGGRGIGAALAMSCNSRVWNKDGSTMTFNYEKGLPAPGWTLGYGRIIKNYDNTGLGFKTGVGSANAPGNFLLLQPDGTRIHLQQVFSTIENTWKHDTTDGTFLHLTFNNKLEYPDGTVVKYDEPNNRLVPTSIKTNNGSLITVAYRKHCNTQDPANGCPRVFKFRYAIDYIVDTLGRYIRFRYYGDTNYPADDANGKPLNALAAITAPDFAGGTAERTLIKIEYQVVTLNYNFGSMSVSAPVVGSQLWMVRRIYYPQTGRGYLMLDFSTYGMARRISVRKDMTGASGTIADGTEIAHTKYDYTTIDPADPYGRNQVGALNDAPQYLKQSEWWQGKTDDNGNSDSQPTDYLFSRSSSTDASGFTTEIDKTTLPNGLEVWTTTGDDPNAPDTEGKVTTTEYKQGTMVLRKMVQSYIAGSDGGIQLSSIESFDENNQGTKIAFNYGNYGRVRKVYEYGFKQSGSYVVRRRTSYFYSDDADHISANLYRLVTRVEAYDGLLDNSDGNDVMIAKTVFILDDYNAKGGMEFYGLTPSSYPPNHDAAYDQNKIKRGNVTGVQSWSNIASNIFTTRHMKLDIFGNVVEADVSCCSVKTFHFSGGTAGHYYSQPDWVRDGPAAGPSLTTSFQHNFETGLPTQVKDPDNQPTTFQYDSAWRLSGVTSATGAATTTSFDKDANGNDQLSYKQQLSYNDSGVSKVITSKSWFDGAGRVLRSGTGAGSSPASFDMAAAVRDRLGRLLKQSNPYAGDSSGNGTASFWTVNTYDVQSRVTTVTLPDLQTIQTLYDGATVTVTDQVGRKRQSQVDGLGRLTSVTEQDPATGNLTLVTNYTFSALDNLTGVNQGGQTRSFVYDALSRVTSQTTPEGGQVTFTYTDFSAVLKRADARNVEIHYKYDMLNRLAQVWHTGNGGSDDPTDLPRPPLPTGVAATSDVIISYRTASPGNGQVESVTDGAGTASYIYDSFGRTTSKTRTIDGNSYQTQYQYNAVNQLALMIYPSGKRVRTNHDLRGRFNGVDKVDTAGNVLAKYVRSVVYNVVGQVSSMGIGELGTNNAVTETYGYDADRLQLTSQSAVNNGGTTLMSLTYGYQAAAGASGVGTMAGNSSQLMSITGTINGQGRNETYTYDDLGRLASASGFYSQRNYTYDRWGNRTAVSGGSSQTVTLQPQPGAPTGVPNNRIATVGSVGCLYDAAGNLTSDGVHTYQYDAEGRVATVDATGVEYSYDSANRRVKKAVGSTTTYYVWEGARVIAEYSNGAAGAGGTGYHLADRLSTRITTDTNGAFKGSQDHLPFGEDAGTSGTTEKHRFTNYERDAESNTDYAINRQHAMVTGRFMQADRVAGGTGNPQSLNRYAYSLNDPVNVADPAGLYASSLFGGYFLDASLSNWGLYIDSSPVLPGQERFFWSYLASGAAVVAPFGSTVYQGSGGTTYRTETRYRSYGNIYDDDPGTARIGVTDVAYQVQVEVPEVRNGNPSEDPFWAQITTITAGSLRILENRPDCRKLLSGFFGDAYKMLDKLWANHKIKSGNLGNSERIMLGESGWSDITLDIRYTLQNPSLGAALIGLGLTPSEQQQQTLLHELGHMTGFWKRHRNQAQSDKYDRQIVEACF